MAAPRLPDDNTHHSQVHPSLLVIEDDVVLLDSVKEVLQFEGFEVYAANNGGDGLAMARELLPEGILLDINLPDMDGYAVLQALQQQEVTRSIPVLMLSGYTQAKRRTKALKLGAAAFVTKPFVTSDLLAEIRRLIFRDTTSQGHHG